MVESLIILMAVVVSLLFACLLSASETAITAMSTAKIYKLKTGGNKRAIIISKLREDKESLISTILLANNGCNILASTMATAFLIKIFGVEKNCPCIQLRLMQLLHLFSCLDFFVFRMQNLYLKCSYCAHIVSHYHKIYQFGSLEAYFF